MNSNENKGGRPAKENGPFTQIFLQLTQGFTQQEIADKVGVSRQNVGKWLSGITTPDISTLCKIADAYEVSTDYLLGRTAVKALDVELQAVAKYLGLSGEAISALCKSPNDLVKNALNSILPELNVYEIALNFLRQSQITALRHAVLVKFISELNVTTTSEEIEEHGECIFSQICSDDITKHELQRKYEGLVIKYAHKLGYGNGKTDLKYQKYLLTDLIDENFSDAFVSFYADSPIAEYYVNYFKEMMSSIDDPEIMLSLEIKQIDFYDSVTNISKQQNKGKGAEQNGEHNGT